MQSHQHYPLSALRFGSYTPIGKDEQKKLTQIVNNLIDIPQATQFLQPVPWKQLQLDDYLDVIRHPMNLYKVQQKIKARDYNTVQQVLDHIQLIWDNCKQYNQEGHYYDIAQKMQKVFKKMIKNYLPAVLLASQTGGINPIMTQPPPVKKYTPQTTTAPATRTSQSNKQSSSKQIQQRNQIVYAQESKSQKQLSYDEPQVQQIPLSQKNRFHQRLKLITQQQLGQIVSLIQQCCSQGFKHISGGRYQIVMDNIDSDTFKKMSQKVDDFIENEKINGIGLGSKKVKV